MGLDISLQWSILGPEFNDVHNVFIGGGFTFMAESGLPTSNLERSGFSGMSVTGFVLSLFGFVLALPAIAGLVLGLIALKNSTHQRKRRGLAIAAIVISTLWILFFGLTLIGALAGNTGSEVEPASNEAGIEQSQEIVGQSGESPNAANENESNAQLVDPGESVDATSTPQPSPSMSVNPQIAFIDDVRASASKDAKHFMDKRKNKELLKAGEEACRQIERRGALVGYGLLYSSMRVTPIELPFVAEAALEHLCPESGVSPDEISAFESSGDQWWLDLAANFPFSIALDEAREQAAQGDDVNLLKDMLLACYVMTNDKRPWEFFTNMDGIQPPGSTPSLLEWRGVLNSAQFYLCPDAPFTYDKIVRGLIDTTLG